MRSRPLPRLLRIIRQAAESVLDFRGESGSEDALKYLLLEISPLIPKCNRNGRDSELWLRIPEQDEIEMDNINECDDDFQQALLAIAVAVNDEDLVKKILIDIKNRPYLVSENGGYEHSYV